MAEVEAVASLVHSGPNPGFQETRRERPITELRFRLRFFYGDVDNMSRSRPLFLPVVSHSAEYLTIGYLMRRNILAYKAPPRNEGYDIICIHPDPKKVRRQIRVQVKSRYQTDSDRAVPVSKETLGTFDYLVIVFLNIGNFYDRPYAPAGAEAPEFYTLPRSFVRRHYHEVKSEFNRVQTAGVRMDRYKNEAGFDLIARDLGIPYATRIGI